jgi:hypothetical protein
LGPCAKTSHRGRASRLLCARRKHPIRQDRTVDNSGNPVQKSYNLNLDTILNDGVSNDGLVGTGSGKLPRNAR